MRLIDADELANMLSRVRQRLDPKTYKTATEFYTRDEMLLNLEQMVRGAPTIDPVKHGRWLKITTHNGCTPDYDCVCSECGASGVPYYNYCPYCGTKMDLFNSED